MRTRPLAGQTAIVTGGARGLGRAAAEVMASAGASVVVASRNAPQLDEVVAAIEKQGGKALAYAADVADERQVQELVLNTERWVGPASILVIEARCRPRKHARQAVDASPGARLYVANAGQPCG
jgi:NAD(P)-dependent dehydrogenase (short-subunit alcohol dehydrogenase family)